MLLQRLHVRVPAELQRIHVVPTAHQHHADRVLPQFVAGLPSLISQAVGQNAIKASANILTPATMHSSGNTTAASQFS